MIKLKHAAGVARIKKLMKTPTLAQVRSVLRQHIETAAYSYAERDGVIRDENHIHEILALREALNLLPRTNQG